MKQLVFVYGSLKQGMMRNNALQGQRYIGIAATAPDYAMFQLSGYPALIDSTHPEAAVLLKEGKSIWGELYEVDGTCVQELDKLEGVGTGLYQRKAIQLKDIMTYTLPSCQDTFASFIAKKAETYFYKKPIGGAKDCGQFWSHR